MAPVGATRERGDSSGRPGARVYHGAIHYRSDIERGKEHGARIGSYAVRFAQQDGAN